MKMQKLPDLSKCRILISNDDGIHAPGLAALESIARQLSKDVWVVAPETEQSGAAHSLTLHTPLRVRQIEPKRFAVSGTPTDCVLLAVKEIMPKKSPPHLVLSGVNLGANLGEDVTYSGTIAVCMEATLLGIPAIAMSQVLNHEKAPFAVATKHGAEIVRKLVSFGIAPHSLMNVNFPSRKVKGVRAAAQGKSKVGENLDKRQDPKGRTYYWIGGSDHESPAGDRESDLGLIQNGYITVTPVYLDLTHYAVLEKLNRSISKDF